MKIFPVFAVTYSLSVASEGSSVYLGRDNLGLQLADTEESDFKRHLSLKMPTTVFWP